MELEAKQNMINAAQLADAQESEERIKSELLSSRKRAVALRMTVNGQAAKIEQLEAELEELKAALLELQPVENPTENKENPDADV